MATRKITNNNRGFKGVWIPSNVWLDKSLSIQEMVFLVEIDSLDINENGCFASNNHFSDFFGLTPSRCSQIITKLKEKGYITISYEYKGKEIDKRVIKVVRKLSTPIKNTKGGIKKIKEGYLENEEGSNTSLSNTNSNTKDNMSGKPDSIPYSQVIDYLNNETGKSFKNVESNRKLIRARFHDGFMLDDFKKVIDTKAADWLHDDKMSSYLRPATLFGNKFDQYLNQKPVKPKQRQNFTQNNDQYSNLGW